jgi:hypothetical protein
LRGGGNTPFPRRKHLLAFRKSFFVLFSSASFYFHNRVQQTSVAVSTRDIVTERGRRIVPQLHAGVKMKGFAHWGTPISRLAVFAEDANREIGVPSRGV